MSTSYKVCKRKGHKRISHSPNGMELAGHGSRKGSKMEKQLEEITVCTLECVLMPQGEIICLGKTIGWFKDFKKRLTPKEEAAKHE